MYASDAINGSSSPRRNLNQVRRHESYYLKGGDLHVLIDDVLFRVHRYFFVRESSYFREELEFPASPGQTTKGTEDSNAIIIVEDRQGRAIHAIDFEKFLWVFYNPLYSLYDTSVEDWGRILHLANTWRFYEVKALCVRELSKLEMLPVDRIHLYQNFEVDQTLLVQCYIQLCSRDTALTVEEGEKLGMKTAMLVMQARERARARDGAKSPLPDSTRAQEIVSLVEELFGVTAGPAPSTPLLTNATLNGTGSPSHVNGTKKTHDKQNSTGSALSDPFSLSAPLANGRPASPPAVNTFSSLGSGPMSVTNAASESRPLRSGCGAQAST
ncbi:hypothetical protein BDV98DRAFT_326668 [Pterulicium gracile]|uniref:BTB domain-containing protein n=1 Tax=Pterulicium gracile TaxID=1884261 RepID=A0A5C3QTF7_9AGAR|nr:hypothetical protein BDV98DRAFT_326668 [Pterula gracilis]